jgi:hypothetical protein
MTISLSASRHAAPLPARPITTTAAKMAGGVQYDAVGTRPTDLIRAEMKPEQNIKDDSAHSIHKSWVRETPKNHLGVQVSCAQGIYTTEKRRLATQRKVSWERGK